MMNNNTDTDNINYDSDASIIYDDDDDDNKIIETKYKCVFQEYDHLCNNTRKCYRCNFKASLTKLVICPYGVEECLNANCDICKYKSRFIYTDRFIVKKKKHNTDDILIGETFTTKEMHIINTNIRRGYWSDVFDVIVEVNQYNENLKKIDDSFVNTSNPIVNEFIRTKKMLVIFLNIDEYTDILGNKHVMCYTNNGCTKEYNYRMKLMYTLIDIWIKSNVDKVVFVKLFQNSFDIDNIVEKFQSLLM